MSSPGRSAHGYGDQRRVTNLSRVHQFQRMFAQRQEAVKQQMEVQYEQAKRVSALEKEEAHEGAAPPPKRPQLAHLILDYQYRKGGADPIKKDLFAKDMK